MTRLEQILVCNLDWLKRLARRYYKDKILAEDLYGDTVYKILKNKSKFNTSEPFKPWAIAVMRNTYITQLARSHKAIFVELDRCGSTPCPGQADSLAIERDLLSAIANASRMSVTVESVLLYAEGYNYDEISSTLGVGVGTVKSRISNGRKLLRLMTG